MKLLYCGNCGDIKSLDHGPRECRCGASVGWYEGPRNARVVGATVLCLGIPNEALREAVYNRYKNPEHDWGVSGVFVHRETAETVSHQRDQRERHPEGSDALDPRRLQAILLEHLGAPRTAVEIALLVAPTYPLALAPADSAGFARPPALDCAQVPIAVSVNGEVIRRLPYVAWTVANDGSRTGRRVLDRDGMPVHVCGLRIDHPETCVEDRRAAGLALPRLDSDALPRRAGDYAIPLPCEPCDGTGRLTLGDDAGSRPCPNCSGVGFVNPEDVLP